MRNENLISRPASSANLSHQPDQIAHDKATLEDKGYVQVNGVQRSMG